MSHSSPPPTSSRERRSPRAALLAAALTLGASACVGAIGGDDGDGTSPTDKVPSTPTNFVCDDTLVPTSLPLRRLSLAQYRNTVGDLVRWLAPSDADSILTDVEPALASVPDDTRIGPDKHFAAYGRLDQAVQQAHVDATYGVAEAVGAAIAASPARLAAAAGDCAVDGDASNDEDCLAELIRAFGEQALRRPVTDEDVAFYAQPAGAAPFEAADYGDVIALLMTSPHMLYFVEHGRDEAGDKVALDGYELASRLSYHFWQTLPDEALFEAARSGELLTEAGYQAQVDRLFASPRTRDALGAFFREWLENTVLEDLDSRSGMPVFDAFAGDFTPGPELRERMIQEVVDAALYYGYETDGTYEDFLESDRSFARTDDLATIYGVPTWDGSGEPPAFTDRAGLVTRAAYLATGSANTRPIMKGVFLRVALLCDEIPPPPANAAANPPELSENLTTREVVEELTGSGACAGCHASILNGLGFATEGFDALGRARTSQTFFDPMTGAEVGKKPVNTVSVPRVDAGDETESQGPADLTRLIVASPKPSACLTRQYFRFTFGRIEDLDLDACALADVKAVVDEGQPLAQALKTLALSAAFRERSFDVE